MRGAVIDTNVFVSGVFWKGPPAQILEAWSQEKFKLILTSEILLEYERVLSELANKYKFNNFERILDLVKLNAEIVSPVSFARPICRDKEDDKFLAAAIGGNAKFIATGDDDLLVLDGHQGLAIIKPKAFLNEIQ